MSDRELLELAAKAADVFLTSETLARAFPKWKWDEYFDLRYENGQGISGAVLVYDYDGKLSGTTREVWNPLTDDGDALRLAVKLRMTMLIKTFPHAVIVEACNGKAPSSMETLADVRFDAGDPYAATRRVIVRAAAEIGRQIP